MAKKRYYAIKVGDGAPCIVDSWNKCKEKVLGYSGAVYKGFSNYNDADAFLNKVSKLSVFSKNEIEGLQVYVDGSYCETTHTYGGAYIIVKNDEILHSWFGSNSNYLSEYRNVAGEILAVYQALLWCLENNMDNVNIHYDYEGINGWAIGNWKCNNELTNEYHEFCKTCMQRIGVKFTKVKAHSGVFWNEQVDKLAKKASGVL